MNSPFLSIIVPIYKVENYLPQCIDSVLNQGFKDFELILIDDGSPDNCGNICDGYAVKDERVKVVHKKNGGLSDARNWGIKNTSGDYLYFLDGDDFLTENCLSAIYLSLNNNIDVDMLICNHNNCVNGSIISNIDGAMAIDLSGVKSGLGLLNAYIAQSAPVPWGVWQSVFKRQIIIDNSIEFEANLIGAEDCDFFNKYIQKAFKFKYLSEPVFNYRQARVGSITCQKSLGFIYGELKTFVKYFRFYSNGNAHCENDKICGYYANWFCNAIAIIFYLKDKNEIATCVNFIDDNKDLLSYTKGFKYSFAKLVWKLFGYYNGSKGLKTIQKVIRKGKL